VSAIQDTISVNLHPNVRSSQLAQPTADSKTEHAYATLDLPSLMIKNHALDAILLTGKSLMVKPVYVKADTSEIAMENASRSFYHQLAKKMKSMTPLEKIVSVFRAVRELKEPVLSFLNAKLMNTITVNAVCVKVDSLPTRKQVSVKKSSSLSQFQPALTTVNSMVSSVYVMRGSSRLNQDCAEFVLPR
jgi:hypothetical protein